MIKAYIYGTPKGFDAYGSDKSFEGYLKGFYIATRRDKRLMVNRRANGETIYSYLHYGLMEYSDLGKGKAGRINSFFGMSLHLSDGIYTPDFKLVFDWFDFWFNKILEDGTILKKVSSGYVQYQVSKFASANYIEQVRSNLPNIFSEKAGTVMLRYDDSFIEGKSGQIASLNDKADSNVILSAFKHYQWVKLSSDVPIDDTVVIDIDFNDLNDKLSEYSKLLLPIAINPKAHSVDELCKIEDGVKEIFSSIESYLKKISKNNTEEYDKFSSLANDCKAVYENITELKKRLIDPGDGSGTDTPATQFCHKCQKNKHISEFSSPNATICIACEKEAEIPSKQCNKCGQIKPITEFSSPNATICIACENEVPTKQCNKCGQIRPITEFEPGAKICKDCAGAGFTIPSWAKIVISSAVILVIGVVCLLKFNSDTLPPPPLKTVDEEIFWSHINKYEYQTAYEYLADKSDRNDYLPIESAINKQMWDIINNGVESYEEYNKTIGNDKVDKVKNVLAGVTLLGDDAITKESKDKISNTIKQFRELVDKLSLEDKNFGPKSHKKASDIIKEGKNYNSKWLDIVASKYDKYKEETNTKPSPPVTTQQDYGSIYLVNLDANYNPIKNNQGVVEVPIVPGKKTECGTYKRKTFVDICYDRNKVKIRRVKELEDNPNPADKDNPQAQNYKLNATYRVRINKAGLEVYEVIYVEDLTGKVLTEITIRTKQ